MTEIWKIDPDHPDEKIITETVAMIQKGMVCAYPTETFYGLGVDVTNDQAVKRLFDIKRRDYGNPVAVIVSDQQMLVSFVEEVPERALALMDLFWPGPLTILFRTNKRISRRLTTNTGKIGIRISSHPVATAIVQRLGRPLSTTSANLSGFPPSLNARHLRNYFGEKLDVILDAGELNPSKGSTVVDVTEDKLTLIREGIIRGELLFRHFQEEGDTIAPFRALRFNPQKVGDLSRVVAPPYDVISPEAQEELYQRDPHNVVRLILGRQFSGDDDKNNRYTRAAADFRVWRDEGILIQDDEESVYLYEQVFEIQGLGPRTRRGFMAVRRLEEYGTGRMIPHEKTLEGPKADRLLLMKGCGANLSPIFALYSDPLRELPGRMEPFFRRDSEVDIFDQEGVRHRLWRVTDQGFFRDVDRILREKKIFIADGHHRYETAMAYRNWIREKEGGLSEDAPSNFVLMYFAEMLDPGLVVLPTHRVLHNFPGFHRPDFEAKLKKEFRITRSDLPLKPFLALLRERGRNGQALGVLFPGEREGWILEGMKPRSKTKIDTMTLHETILGHQDPRFLRFVQEEEEISASLKESDVQAVFLLNAPRMEDLREVFEAGQVLPPKSTFFYPKLLSGLLINPV